MIDLKKILGANFRRNMRYVLSFVPDKLYLKIHYYLTTGKILSFKNPKGFCEKLQWLKVYDRNYEYTKLVDKYAVREHIKEVLGEEYLFPLLGTWDCFDDIDFSQLPNKFILKCNHDSGSTKVITDKKSLNKRDIEKLKTHFSNRLKRDYFYAGREYPYKGIKPCIIAEQFMINESSPEKSIEDYKFFCFNGKPEIMFVATDRNTDVKFDFFDMEFNHLDIENIHPQSGKTLQKPRHFEEMKKIAGKLSEGIKHVRVDLYEFNDKIYFGEYTFFHGGGFVHMHPEEWEMRLGDLIQ